MRAIRVENPTMDQYRKGLTKLTGYSFDLDSAEQFLSSPVVVNKDISNYENILKNEFNFNVDPTQEQIYRRVMVKLHPHINEFISLVQQGTPKSELLQAFHAIENYSITLRTAYEDEMKGSNVVYMYGRRDIENLDQMRQIYNYEPPEVLGSCGGTGQSSNIFDSFSSLKSIFDPSESSDFVCPKCTQSSKTPIGDSCPKCGFTKQQAEKEGMAVC